MDGRLGTVLPDGQKDPSGDLPPPQGGWLKSSTLRPVEDRIDIGERRLAHLAPQLSKPQSLGL